MALVLRPAGYTGSLQQITWAQGNNVPVSAHLWGGGGGGGGSDASGIGGLGSGSQYSTVNFTISDGDVLELAVGGPGGGGQGSAGNAAGGTPGASYTAETIFNTRTATPSSGPGGPVVPQFNSRYCTFLNTNGVWINPSSAAGFDKTYLVYFPTSARYQFQASADNFATFLIDGVAYFNAYDYQRTYEVGIFVSAGTHAIRILGYNYGGPASVALSISGAGNFGGGGGGNAGNLGSSGGGGGGGGATVLLKNGEIIAVAGGGGGGGGAGNQGVVFGDNAPGGGGQAAPGENAGQNGTKPSNGLAFFGDDGGGGGGGGGGYGGGNGGFVRFGDQGGYAGSIGGGIGNVSNPLGPIPGGYNTPYYVRNVGFGGFYNGGNGTAGYAMLTFDVNGIWVNQAGQGWVQTKDVYVNANGTWNRAQGVWVNNAGVWEPVISSYAPDWVQVPGKFGIGPRPAAPDVVWPIFDPGTGAGGFADVGTDSGTDSGTDGGTSSGGSGNSAGDGNAGDGGTGGGDGSGSGGGTGTA